MLVNLKLVEDFDLIADYNFIVSSGKGYAT